MGLYLIIHKWKAEDTKKVARKVIEALTNLPEGFKICSSYLLPEDSKAVCVWEAPSATELTKFFKENIPEMEEKGTYPAIQFYPPSMDIYKIMHSLTS